MRFALELSHHAWTTGDATARLERTVELAREADAAGLDSLWLSEDPDGWDAFAVLGALARETGRIRLGPGVTNPYLRHPNLIAASVATLDRLSGGRAFLGLGRGQPEWYRSALGIETGSPLAALEQTIDLVRQWWQPPHRASGEGAFAVRGWERTLSPVVSPPGPPVYLAAVGPKALALAGRVADGVRFNELASPEFLQEAIASVRRAAVEADRDPAALRFFVHPSLTVTDDPAMALERKKTTVALIHALPGMARQLETPGIDVAGIMATVRRLMRTEEVLARGGGFADLRRAGDFSAARRAIPMELMERVAIAGPLPFVRRRLADLEALGATDVFLDLDRLGPDDGTAADLLRDLTAAGS